MKRAIPVVFGLATVMIVLGGCSGMKVTFVNETTNPVDTEFVTQGRGRVSLGQIPPGKQAARRVEFDEELLPADFSITIDGGTARTLTKIVRISKKYPRKLNVRIRPDADMDRIIEVRDAQGLLVPTR